MSSVEGQAYLIGNKFRGDQITAPFEIQRPWGLLIGMVFVVHATLCLTVPDAIWTTPVGIGSACMVGLALCIIRARDDEPEMRWRWQTLACAFALWAAAHVVIAGLQLILPPGVDHFPLDWLLSILRGVPYLLLLARSGDGDEGHAFRQIDSAQALLFACLALLLLFPGLLPGSIGGMTPPESTMSVYHDTQNFGLAFLSLLGLPGQPTPARRRFAQALCALLVSYAVLAFIINHFVVYAYMPGPGELFNVVGDIAPGIFVLVAARRSDGQDRAVPDRRAQIIIRQTLPIAFCGASLALSFAIASRDHPVIGAAGAVAALTLFATRSLLVQDQLRDLQRFISEIVERLPDAVCVVGADDLVAFGNRAASTLFETDVRGALFPDLIPLLGIDRSTLGEIEMPDGRTMIMAEAPLTTGGRIVRFTDITRVRGTERDREEALQFLSHDMRSPHAAILTLLEGHERDIEQPPEFFDRVRRYARHGLKMADDFVRLARLRTAAIVREPVDVGDAAAEAADMVWPLARERHITLDDDCGEIEAWVLGDRALLVRAIHNLLDNGVKFAPEGSALSYGLSVRDDVVQIRVSGRGPEMPPDRVDDLFGRFGPGRHGAGLDSVGLGLAFVNATVRRHGGTVGYLPTDDCHVFLIELPALLADAEV